MAEKKKILLVEDETDFRSAIKIRLESAGYELIEASDGMSGLELARRQSPDLVILDLMLPKMDGYKVCRLLKFDEKHKHVPIIMMTARSQPSDRETGMSVGADEYLTKPCKPGVMLETITRLLNE